MPIQNIPDAGASYGEQVEPVLPTTWWMSRKGKLWQDGKKQYKADYCNTFTLQEIAICSLEINIMMRIDNYY